MVTIKKVSRRNPLNKILLLPQISTMPCYFSLLILTDYKKQFYIFICLNEGAVIIKDNNALITAASGNNGHISDKGQSRELKYIGVSVTSRDDKKTKKFIMYNDDNKILFSKWITN